MVWVELYQSLEHERIAEASKIRANLGMDPTVSENFINLVRGYETRFHLEFHEKEQRLGDQRPPDPSYLASLENAISILERKKANGEPTWYKGFEEQQSVQLKGKSNGRDKVVGRKKRGKRSAVRRVSNGRGRNKGGVRDAAEL